MKYLIVIFFALTLSAFSQNAKDSKELREVKERVKESIDKYAFDEDSNKRSYKVVYEGDYIRLLIMKRNGSAPINKGILFDFSNVYKFEDISKRRKDIAYINIWTSILKNKKKNKWDKHKLIMRVYGHKHAETIMKALKDYNNLLKK